MVAGEGSAINRSAVTGLMKYCEWTRPLAGGGVGRGCQTIRPRKCRQRDVVDSRRARARVLTENNRWPCPMRLRAFPCRTVCPDHHSPINFTYGKTSLLIYPGDQTHLFETRFRDERSEEPKTTIRHKYNYYFDTTATGFRFSLFSLCHSCVSSSCSFFRGRRVVFGRRAILSYAPERFSVVSRYFSTDTRNAKGRCR